MKTLITGGAGFIGTHLTQRLLERGDEVSILDNLSTGKSENIDKFKGHSDFSYEVAEISDSSILNQLVSEVDAIIHLAAVVGVQLVLKKPTETLQTNVLGTHTVLEAARQCGCPTLIASTSEVYGKGNNIPFNEDDDILIGSPSYSRWSYAISKLHDESLGLAVYKEKKLPVTIVRFFNTVGPGQTGRYGMVIPRFVQQALKGEPLTVYGDGKQSRCFCHVHDTVQALLDLLDCLEQTAGEIYNIGSTTETTINELANRVIERTATTSKISYVPYHESYAHGFEDIRRRVPDTKKIQKAIGWQATRNLDQIIDDVITYEQENLFSC